MSCYTPHHTTHHTIPYHTILPRTPPARPRYFFKKAWTRMYLITKPYPPTDIKWPAPKHFHFNCTEWVIKITGPLWQLPFEGLAQIDISMIQASSYYNMYCIWIIFTNPNEYLQDKGMGLVAKGTDCSEGEVGLQPSPTGNYYCFLWRLP